MATPIPRNRARFTLAEIAHATSGMVIGPAPRVGCVGVVTDSRAVEAGNLYVALRGERHDGHCFVPQAASNGATACLVQDRAALPRDATGVLVTDTLRALGDLAGAHIRRWGGRVIAITGSAGKTTTKELTFAALQAAGARVARSEGNLNNLVGVPMSALALDSQHELAVLELGTSAPGEIARLAEITGPVVAVVLGAAAAHTAGLGTLEQVAAEKASLLWALPEHGTAIYRADDMALAGQLARVRAQRRLAFGIAQSAAVRLCDQTLTAAPGMACALRIDELSRTLRCELSLFGLGPALDAAAAISVAYAVLGEGALERAAQGLKQVAPPPGRLSPVAGRAGCLLLDDTYNANPASMRASIETALELARLRSGRALLVLGDMLELGERSRAEHELVGKLAAQPPVSVLLACGPEMTAAAEAAREQARRKQHELSVSHLSDPKSAGELLAPLLQERDVVLVKGSRSMHMERALEPLQGEHA